MLRSGDCDFECDESVLPGKVQIRPDAGRAVRGFMDAGGFGALIDEFAFGILIVDSAMRLVQGNRTARVELRSGTFLRIVRGRLTATDPQHGDRIEQAVAAALSGRRTYLMLGDATRRSGLAVLPVSAGHDGDTQAALLLEKPENATSLGLVFFSQACGLTPREQAVLGALANGAAVHEVAAELNCAVNTVRSHVRKLLVKTGQKNLRSLCGQIGRLPPLASRVFDMREVSFQDTSSTGRLDDT